MLLGPRPRKPAPAPGLRPRLRLRPGPSHSASRAALGMGACMHACRYLKGLAGTRLLRLGIPYEAQFVDGYLRRVEQRPLPPLVWRFFLALSLFRVCAIAQVGGACLPRSPLAVTGATGRHRSLPLLTIACLAMHRCDFRHDSPLIARSPRPRRRPGRLRASAARQLVGRVRARRDGGRHLQ